MAGAGQDNTDYEIEVGNASIHWHLDKGTFDFYGIPSALFWIDPSLSRMLLPIAEEIGFDLYRMLVAYSSSRGTDEDYQTIVNVLGDNFVEGFLAWGKVVSASGWGIFELPQFDFEKKTAVVRVRNAWELIMQQKHEPEQTFGCPFLLGKIIGIFSHALGVNCWADGNIDWAECTVEFHIYPSEKTISDEIEKIKAQKNKDREDNLKIEVEKKTSELEKSNQKLSEQSEELKRKGYELKKALDEARGAREELKKELERQEEARLLKEKMERLERYIVFAVKDEEYCINILKIQEVIMTMPITRVPRVPHFIKGVINLRGKVIPVMDLRLKLGMEDIPYTDRTCFIIVNSGDIMIGIAVDSVLGVSNIRGREIEDSLVLDGKPKPDYILGIAKSDDRVRIVIDFDNILSRKEKDVLASQTAV